MITAQNFEARHRKAVIFCCDKNVIDFAEFLIRQILAREPEPGFDICITSFDESLISRPLPDPRIRFCIIDDARFQGVAADIRIPLTGYLRLALPEIFANDYDRIIYLDTDIYLQNGKISDMFTAMPPGQAIGGVLEGAQWFGLGSKSISRYCRIIGVFPRRYMNSGVILMDVAECNARNLPARFLENATKIPNWRKDHPDIMFQHDQTAINTTLKGDWFALPLKWNFQTVRFSVPLIGRMRPNLVHFTGATKPWMESPRPYIRKYLRNHLADYQAYFANVLKRPLPRSNRRSVYQLEKPDDAALARSMQLAPKVKPPGQLFYFLARNRLLPGFLIRRHLQKLDARMAAGKPIWPGSEPEP